MQVGFWWLLEEKRNRWPKRSQNQRKVPAVKQNRVPEPSAGFDSA